MATEGFLVVAFVILWFLIDLPYWSIVALVIGLVVWEVVIRWQWHFKPHDEYEQQLAKASHGAAFILLTPLVTRFIERECLTHYLPPEWVAWLWPAAFAFMGLGVFWLVFGASRTRAYSRDANMIARALVKFAIGAALQVALCTHFIPPQQMYVSIGLVWFSMWLIITASTKLVLLARRPRQSPEDSGPSESRFMRGWHL